MSKRFESRQDTAVEFQLLDETDDRIVATYPTVEDAHEGFAWLRGRTGVPYRIERVEQTVITQTERTVVPAPVPSSVTLEGHSLPNEH